jgi:hypothetical protein
VDGEIELALRGEASEGKFMGQAGFVGGFEEAGA